MNNIILITISSPPSTGKRYYEDAIQKAAEAAGDIFVSDATKAGLQSLAKSNPDKKIIVVKSKHK